MNARQLQEAIDKTRAWLSPQIDSKTIASFSAKTHAVETLAQLEKIQVQRAAMITTPRTTLKDMK